MSAYVAWSMVGRVELKFNKAQADGGSDREPLNSEWLVIYDATLERPTG